MPVSLIILLSLLIIINNIYPVITITTGINIAYMLFFNLLYKEKKI